MYFEDTIDVVVEFSILTLQTETKFALLERGMKTKYYSSPIEAFCRGNQIPDCVL